MRAVFIILLLIFLLSGCLKIRTIINEIAPARIPAGTNNTESTIICGVTVEAKPGIAEWTTWLEDNLVLDEASMDTIPPGTYKVIVQFVIDTKGKISDVSVVKDPGFALGERVKKVVADYKGEWKPAEMYGRPVMSYRKQPVTFIIEERVEECENETPAELIL